MTELLTDDQLQTIQRLLDDREAELQREVRDAKQAASELPNAHGRQVEDQAEVGEQRFQRGIEHVELQRDQEELRAIDEARGRIASGRYGECIGCGRAIAFERLQVQPSAVRCIDCQSVWERTHANLPGFTL